MDDLSNTFQNINGVKHFDKWGTIIIIFTVQSTAVKSFQAVLKMFEFYFGWYLTERILFLYYLGEVEMSSVLFFPCSPCLSSCLFICSGCSALLHMVLRAFGSYVSSVVSIFPYYLKVW